MKRKMTEKVYNERGFTVIGKRYVIMFNDAPYLGYDWYTDDNLNWIGIKNNKNTMSVTYEKSMSVIWRKLLPYL